jgi:sugar phosphate permease
LDSFEAFAVGRLSLGALQSFMVPFGYGLVDKWFAPSQRGTGTSIFNSAIYIGGAVASLNLLFTEKLGWRTDL